ncbi:MAG: hypothetical protein ACKVOX_00370 [Rhizobacter sp.]
MSKLLELRDWVSVGDAARHLTTHLGEEVRATDLYHLALEERVVLSIRCLEPVAGRRVEHHDPTVSAFSFPDGGLMLDNNAPLHYVGSKVEFFDGVLDLPMIGGERVVVRGIEWSPESDQDEFTFDEVLLRSSDGVLFCVMERKEGGAVAPYDDAKNFDHRYSLPRQVKFVLRTSELIGLKVKLARGYGNAKEVSEPLAPRSETTYLTIIGALLELVRNPRPGRDSDAAVIREMIDNYSDKPGISKTTLEAKFADARRRLNST